MKNILLIILLSIIFVSTGCVKHEHVKTPLVNGIETQTIKVQKVDDFYETSALIKSKTTSIVSSMLMGRITSIRVNEGDYVREGQILLTIDNRDLSQKAAGAKAGLVGAQKAAQAALQGKQLAEKTYQRYKMLYDEKVITRQEFDTIFMKKEVADLEYQRALEGVNQARAGLGEVGVYQSYSKVTSPISGIVVRKNIDVGSTAIQGQPLFTIEGPSNMEILAQVNEKYLGKVKKSENVKLDVDGKIFDAKITNIVSSINPVTHTFLIKLDSKGLTAGSYAKILIPVGEKEAVLVPESSVVKKGQLTGVYTVDEDNIISYRLVKLGKTYDKKVEILSGLSDGEKIIITGTEKAIDGGKIK